MVESFHLKSVLLQIKPLIALFGHPVVILIDDAHLIRYGSVLSRLEKPVLDSLGQYLSIIVFSANSNPISGLPLTPELVELTRPNQNCSLLILKNRCQQMWNQTLDTNQAAIVRQHV